MKIAYDLRFASEHFTGIGRFAVSVLAGLLAGGDDDRFDVLWDPAARAGFDPEPFRRDPRVRWMEFPGHPFALLDAPRLGARLRRSRPDVYLSPFWRAPLRGGVPLVLTIHDVLPFRHPERFDPARRLAMELVLRWLAKRAQWLTVSEWSRAEIVACTSIPAERIHVMRMFEPLPTPTVESRRPAGVPDSPFALAVGINKPHKNLGMLGEVWRRPGIAERLRLVWAGPRDPRFAAPGDDGGGWVHALGRVSDAELAWLYRHASVFVFPTTYEGFGVPLLEAMHAGTPAIVSDIPPLREVGSDAPLYVPARDPAAWAAAIESVSEDAVEWRRRVAAGRRRALEFDGRHDRRILREVLAGAVAEAR